MVDSISVRRAWVIGPDSGLTPGADPRRDDYFCWPIQEKMAREWVMTVPSGSLSAGSFVAPVAPVASRSSSREPLRRKGNGLPWPAIVRRLAAHGARLL